MTPMVVFHGAKQKGNMIELDKIYLEDCLEGMKKIDDCSVDCIICDLPYGVTKCHWDCKIPFKPLWEQYLRVIKPNGAILLFCQGMFTAEVIMSQPKYWRYNLVWNKVNTTGFLNASRQPLRQHEDIAVFYKKSPVYNPQMQKSKPHYRNHGASKNGCTNRHYNAFKTTNRELSDCKFPTSIITISKAFRERNDHPTQKPVDLYAYLIRTYTNKGDLILDNCIGCGTAAIAAIREGRHFIGFETCEEYYNIAIDRIKKEQS